MRRLFRGTTRDLSRGSKRRIRGLRARDHTSLGLLVFLATVLVSACVLAVITAQCQRHHPVGPPSRITSNLNSPSAGAIGKPIAPDLRNNPVNAVPELWNRDR
jgi:hypothetical protein